MTEKNAIELRPSMPDEKKDALWFYEDDSEQEAERYAESRYAVSSGGGGGGGK